MGSNYFSISYSVSTVSSVLLYINNHKEDGIFKVTPLIVANECDDYFVEFSNLVDVMAEKTNALKMQIQPAMVANILIDVGYKFAYDELSIEHLVKAIEIHINQTDSVSSIDQICEMVTKPSK
ncbi:hypothetical protein FXE80_01235 [Vibrio cholerae]|uniref:hypothetical protein n=1 Tax=Vibrio cholerae TaxID=666 RepID=UPI0011D4B3EC|nr:hypothetical protein [Vibrio cholerae]TXY78009.1 hypothetical protein FXE80_01235 [Vibrio cholerae]GIB16855.1 hypothetical protein VCSRO90_2833 [Vibrio cholerae]